MSSLKVWRSEMRLFKSLIDMNCHVPWSGQVTTRTEEKSRKQTYRMLTVSGNTRFGFILGQIPVDQQPSAIGSDHNVPNANITVQNVPLLVCFFVGYENYVSRCFGEASDNIPISASLITITSSQADRKVKSFWATTSNINR